MSTIISSSLLDPLKSILVFNRRRVYIDNVVFRMHYVWTVILLVVSAILVSSKMYIGDPINCISSPDMIDIVKEFCYIHSTFTRGRFVKGSWIYEPAKSYEIYPGVRPGLTQDRIVVHSYYQWVWCILSLQAIAFYFPHWAWEKLERGTTMMLLGDLNLPMLSDEKKNKQRRRIILYLRRNHGHHRNYAIYYALSEVANLLNILFQLYLIDYFLDKSFSTYGLQVFSLTNRRPYERDDKLARVFPTVTACRMLTGGVAFGKVKHDILCVLPINILNEKLFIVLWFWFIILLVCSIFAVVYRIASSYKPVRILMLKRKLREQCHHLSAERVCRVSSYGDWFLIYKLSQNMDTLTFGDLVEDIDHAWRKWNVGRSQEEEGLITAPPPSISTTPVPSRKEVGHEV